MTISEGEITCRGCGVMHPCVVEERPEQWLIKLPGGWVFKQLSFSGETVVCAFCPTCKGKKHDGVQDTKPR